MFYLKAGSWSQTSIHSIVRTCHPGSRYVTWAVQYSLAALQSNAVIPTLINEKFNQNTDMEINADMSAVVFLSY